MQRTFAHAPTTTCNLLTGPELKAACISARHSVCGMDQFAPSDFGLPSDEIYVWLALLLTLVEEGAPWPKDLREGKAPCVTTPPPFANVGDHGAHDGLAQPARIFRLLFHGVLHHYSVSDPGLPREVGLSRAPAQIAPGTCPPCWSGSHLRYVGAKPGGLVSPLTREHAIGGAGVEHSLELRENP